MEIIYNMGNLLNINYFTMFKAIIKKFMDRQRKVVDQANDVAIDNSKKVPNLDQAANLLEKG